MLTGQSSSHDISARSWTHQGFLSSLGSELRIGSPSDDIVSHLLGPVALPFVAIEVGRDVVPALSVSTCPNEGNRDQLGFLYCKTSLVYAHHRSILCTTRLRGRRLGALLVSATTSQPRDQTSAYPSQLTLNLLLEVGPTLGRFIDQSKGRISQLAGLELYAVLLGLFEETGYGLRCVTTSSESAGRTVLTQQRELTSNLAYTGLFEPRSTAV
jgi:hypothetical protein